MSKVVKPVTAVTADPAKRAYDATRRQAQAQQNRLAILDAGRRLFLEHGYARTTINMVATVAGVSTQLVYQAFDNKPGLVKALVDVAIVGDDDPVPMMERDFVHRNMAEPDPIEKLRMYGAHYAEHVAPRVNPIALVVRDAAAADTTARGLWEQLQTERLTGMTHFARHLHEGNHLRSGVSTAEARDVLWTFNSLEVWDLLVQQRGWTNKRLGRWIGDQLVSALL